MADFFDEMAEMARELLAPTSQDGMGAGTISLVRVTPGVPSTNPKDPPPEPTLEVLPIRAQAFGVVADLVGTEAAPGVTIVATDLRVISERISGAYGPENMLRIDGRDLTILRVRDIVAAGTRSAVEFIVRG